MAAFTTVWRRLGGGVLLTTALLLATPAAVRSHALESSLERLSSLNNQLLLESRFGSGEPAGDALVRLMAPNGEAVELGRTDAQGKLRFRLPAQVGANWELQVDGGPGHRDYLELPASSGPSAQVRSKTGVPVLAATHRTPLLAAGLLGFSGLGLGSVGWVRWRRQAQASRR